MGVDNLVVLDAVAALDGRRLCEAGRAARGEGCLDLAERRRRRQDRVGEPDPHRGHRLRPLPAAGGHPPDYWGELASRSCLRLAYNGGDVRGGRCVRQVNGLAGGEPLMQLI
jgi:hypothetical protein